MSGRVLFLGGTGVISAGSVALAAERGWEVTVLNRGESKVRPVPKGVELISADVREPGAVAAALGGRSFDVICDFLSFTPDQLKQTLEQVENSTDQYLFVSTASAYQTPPTLLPITEAVPPSNPYREYSRSRPRASGTRSRAGRLLAAGAVVRLSHT